MNDEGMSPGQLNEAIVWSLTNGTPKGAPIISRENMVGHYGEALADSLLDEIRPLLRELMSIPVDWSVQSWQEAGDFVRDTMLARHPHLSSDAAARLRGYFMYQTK